MAAFNAPNLNKAIKVAQDMGLAVSGYEITPEGGFKVLTAPDVTDPADNPRPFEVLSKEEKAEYLHFNDLRGTAVTLISVAGCNIPQICSITGHTLQSATSIL